MVLQVEGAQRRGSMLVLSRKLNETIRIGSDIEVTILSVKGGKVRLGLDAPREVPICRAELCTAAESKQAGNLSAGDGDDKGP
jgi:carbon storage regulator